MSERPIASSKKEIDTALKVLSSHSMEWARLRVEDRISLVEQIVNDFSKVCDRWSELSVAAKGTSQRILGNDDEWLDIAVINRIHTLLIRSLRYLKDNRKPHVKGGYHLLSNGQVVARVYPDSLVHSLAFRGVKMEVWLEPGVSIEEAEKKQAENYCNQDIPNRIALVLGAGNASCLVPSDVMHKLFHDLTVVILKMNPVNSYLGPLLEEAYQELIKRGFLKIVYGGPEEGNYLVNHDLVDEIHMTGSDRTFDSIVFGQGAEGIQRKKNGDPLVAKPVQGELGCITPWIIVPGEWTKKDLREQASKLAFWITKNEGCLCFTPRIIVLHRNWELGESFQEELLKTLSKVKTVKAYYPGSAEIQKTFVSDHPESIEIGNNREGHIPWTVIPNLNPDKTEEICFRRESFSGLCGIVPLEAPTTPEFINRAVLFLNNKVWGTLSVTLVVSEKGLKNPSIKKAVERSISDLQYGTVSLNGSWGVYPMIAPWGGYPGSTIQDIQSGTCKVSNFLFLHRPQKTVIRVPFNIKPYPYRGTARNLDRFSKKLAQFEKNPGYTKLPGLFWSAIRT